MINQITFSSTELKALKMLLSNVPDLDVESGMVVDSLDGLAGTEKQDFIEKIERIYKYA